MTDDDKAKTTTTDAPKRDSTEKPLIFISHDVRDREDQSESSHRLPPPVRTRCVCSCRVGSAHHTSQSRTITRALLGHRHPI